MSICAPTSWMNTKLDAITQFQQSADAEVVQRSSAKHRAANERCQAEAGLDTTSSRCLLMVHLYTAATV